MQVVIVLVIILQMIEFVNAGSLAICVAQPMDVVKIRMQVNIMMTHGDIFIDSESIGCRSRVQI